MTKAGLQDRVHFLHGIPSDDLPAIYQSAETFVYPSVYEGFGIPILEALHSGIPVVAATGSCLEEAGGSIHCMCVPMMWRDWRQRLPVHKSLLCVPP